MKKRYQMIKYIFKKIFEKKNVFCWNTNPKFTEIDGICINALKIFSRVLKLDFSYYRFPAHLRYFNRRCSLIGHFEVISRGYYDDQYDCLIQKLPRSSLSFVVLLWTYHTSILITKHTCLCFKDLIKEPKFVLSSYKSYRYIL